MVFGFALRRNLRLDRTFRHPAKWERRRADQYRDNWPNKKRTVNGKRIHDIQYRILHRSGLYHRLE